MSVLDFIFILSLSKFGWVMTADFWANMDPDFRLGPVTIELEKDFFVIRNLPLL